VLGVEVTGETVEEKGSILLKSEIIGVLLVGLAILVGAGENVKRETLGLFEVGSAAGDVDDS